jgi:hypothetical protein
MTNYLYSFPSAGLRPVETAGIEAWEEDTATVSTLDLGSESTPDVQCYVNTKDARNVETFDTYRPDVSVSHENKPLRNLGPSWTKWLIQKNPPFSDMEAWKWMNGRLLASPTGNVFFSASLHHVFPTLEFGLSTIRIFSEVSWETLLTKQKKGRYTWDAIIEGKLPPEDFWYGLLHTL